MTLVALNSATRTPDALWRRSALHGSLRPGPEPPTEHEDPFRLFEVRIKCHVRVLQEPFRGAGMRPHPRDMALQRLLTATELPGQLRGQF